MYDRGRFVYRGRSIDCNTELRKARAMGNCLGNRRDSDSLLMCGDDEDGQCKWLIISLITAELLNMIIIEVEAQTATRFNTHFVLSSCIGTRSAPETRTGGLAL